MQLELENPKAHDWAELPPYVEVEGETIIVGKIALDNNASGRELNQSDLDGLMALAESAAFTIRHAQLHLDAQNTLEETEARISQQSALLRISNSVQRMSQPADLEGVLADSLNEIRGLDMNVDAIAIHRIVDSEQSAIETTRTSTNGSITVAERRRGPGLTQLWRDRTSDYTPDIEVDTPGKGLVAFREKFGGLPVRTVLDLPFSLGVVSAHSCSPDAFDAHDHHVLIQMAEVISLGIIRMEDLREAGAARDALLESERRYREIVDGAPLCIHEVDLDGRLTSMNRAGLRMMDIESELDLVGMPYLDAVSDEDKPRSNRLLDQARRGIVSFFEFRSSQDRYFESSFIPLLAEDGQTFKIIGMTQDITERKHADTALTQSEAAHRAAIESIGGTPYNFNLDSGKYDYMGEGVRDLFGRTAQAFTVDFLDSRNLETVELGVVSRQSEADRQSEWDVKEYTVLGEDG